MPVEHWIHLSPSLESHAANYNVMLSRMLLRQNVSGSGSATYISRRYLYFYQVLSNASIFRRHIGVGSSLLSFGLHVWYFTSCIWVSLLCRCPSYSGESGDSIQHFRTPPRGFRSRWNLFSLVPAILVGRRSRAVSMHPQMLFLMLSPERPKRLI